MAPKKENTEVEPEYTVEEFAAGAGTIFSEAVSPDIVTAALRMAGVNKITKSAAQKIIEKFKTKEV